VDSKCFIYIDKYLMPIPAETAPEIQRADKYARAEKETGAGNDSRIPKPRRCTCRIPPGAINPAWIINRNINNLGGSRLDRYCPFLGSYLLRICGRKVALSLRFGAQTLDCIHHLLLLTKKGIPQIIGQIKFVTHHGEHIGKVA
jgi:hypothetical protein